MITIYLTLLIIASAYLCIKSEYEGPRYQVYIFKPLTMVLIILIAILAGKHEFSIYKYAILVGLLCSLLGDIFLMLPRYRFIAGLVSFLIAHILYIIAFTQGLEFRFTIWIFLPFLIYGIFIFYLLTPYLGKMKTPVIIYMIVISIMAWQAWERSHLIEQKSALSAGLGVILFVISDSLLAFNKFRLEFRSAQALILSTYFTAQWLIALSVFH